MAWWELQERFKKLQKAFTDTEYIGNADVEFGKHLRRCYETYSRTISIARSTAPCVAVTQSSGFGKSRMIWELALKAKDDKEMNMKVLYLCVRKEFWTGYPEPTIQLYNWLFRSRHTSISQQLKKIYYYAITHWDTVQSEWQELFTDTNADRVVQALTKVAVKVEMTSAMIPGEKIVVVVVDDARNLIENGFNRINVFHKALVSANTTIGNEGGIFGVLVDTNPLISNPSPPESSSSDGLSSDSHLASFPPFVLTHTMDANWKGYCRDALRRSSSSREEEKKEDGESVVNEEEAEVSMEDQVAVYKRLVTRRKRRNAFDALMRMGRPMWHSIYSNWTLTDPITIAACELMMGLNLVNSVRTNFTEEAMYGVASVLCRIGVRPRWTSGSMFAPRIVTNFMATLTAINSDRDCCVCKYVSDPILTAGAMRVWHERNNGLSTYILPQLEQLMADELLDIGDSGQVVATIVMLLAMDAYVVSADRFGRADYYQIVKFVRVKKFLEVFNVLEMQISYNGVFNEEKRPRFDQWMSKWKKWRMGFSHFMQLSLEPNEDTLWYLLGRRAAGIFPRGDDGADLLIPMFTKDSSGKSKVSMMLIFVKTRSEEMVVEELPVHKFDRENSLCQIPVHDIINIYLNVGNAVKDSFRFIRAEPLGTSLSKSTGSNEASLDRSADEDDSEQQEKTVRNGVETGDVMFSLCFGSVCRGTFSFLRKEVAERLRNIANYDPTNLMALVDFNLKRYQDEQERRKRTSRANLTELMPCKTLRKPVFSVLAHGSRIEKTGKYLKRGRDDQGDPQTDPAPKRRMMAFEIYMLQQNP